LAEQILSVVNELLTQRGLLLKAGTAVDATLIAAPTSTKNKDKTRDPEMHSSKKGNQWYFGMKCGLSGCRPQRIFSTSTPAPPPSSVFHHPGRRPAFM